MRACGGGEYTCGEEYMENNYKHVPLERVCLLRQLDTDFNIARSLPGAGGSGGGGSGVFEE